LRPRLGRRDDGTRGKEQHSPAIEHSYPGPTTPQATPRPLAELAGSRGVPVQSTP
jgi:hypothetical protein